MNATLFPPNSSLFLGDLSKFCTEADLEKIFSQFGEINQIRIMRNTNTGKALSYGFISFMSNECAASAMEKLNGISLHGRSMRIGWAAHNLKTHKTEEPAIINSVYVRFITPKTSEYVTEEVIHRAFDQFGSVVDVSIKQSAVDQRSGRQSGYGFVHFSADHAGIIAAFDALSRMNNNTYDGVTYSVEPSKNLLRQMDEMNLGVGGLAGRGGGGGRGGHGNNNHASLMPLSTPPQHHQPPQYPHQQSLYSRNALPQGRTDVPYRPQQQHQTRDDYPKLYQQPSHMSLHGQGTALGGSMYPPSATSRYDSGAQSYGVSSALQHHRQQQQQQTHFEPHTHRYAPQQQQQQQQQSYGRQGNQYGGDGSMYASGFGPTPSSLGAEDIYARPQHSYSQSSDPLSLSVLAPGGQGQGQGPVKGSSQGHSPRAVSQTMSTSPGATGGAGHVRHSSRDLDFAPAILAPVDEYVSSYLIEKPAIDERFFDAPGNSAHQQESNPVPSSYSYGQPHAQPLGGMVSGDRDRRGGLSSNSHSFYSNLPVSSARPPHAPSQHGQQHQQQQSRRPMGVTDLEIGRSRSMSSAGLPTYSTNATTDCEGGFFKSANSSFTENANPRFAHLNSFGDFHSPHNHTALLSQSTDTWTGISDQQTGLLTHEALQRQPVHHPHSHAHSHHQPLASSMRKLSMQSVTTNGAEEEEDVNDLVEDDYTFAAALASTHETAGSQDSLFNYMDSNASSFALPSPPYGSSYSSSQNNCSSNVKGMGFSLKDGCATADNPPQQKGPSSSGISAQQQYQHQQEKHYGSEMDELALEAKQLSLSSVSSGSNTARSNGSNSEDKKTSPKSRQLAVTHFFKPVASV